MPDRQMTQTLDSRIQQDGWLFIRRILCQGHAQQQDYASGKYENYEWFMSRVDEAARERLEQLWQLVGLATEDTNNGHIRAIRHP